MNVTTKRTLAALLCLVAAPALADTASDPKVQQFLSGASIFGFAGAIVCAIAAYESRKDLIRMVGCVLIGFVCLSIGVSNFHHG